MAYKGQNTDWATHKTAIINAAKGGPSGYAIIAARLMVSIQSIRKKLQEWGIVEKRAHAWGDPDRDKLIRKWATEEGAAPAEIVCRLQAAGMPTTRNAVIGVLHRAGIHTKNPPKVAGEAKQRQLDGARKGMQRIRGLELRWENGKRRNQGKPPIPSPLAPIVRDTKSRPNIRIKAKRESAALVVNPAPRRLMNVEIAPPKTIPMPKTEIEARATPGAHLLDRTGCAWPLDGVCPWPRGLSFMFCNEPRAQRRGADGKPETLSLCVHHWNLGHSGRALKPLNLTKRHLGG